MSQEPVDLRALTDAQEARRRDRLALALAVTLVADTAVRLGRRGRPPTVMISHSYHEPVLEGTTLTVNVEVENADEVEIRVPGEQAPRRFVPGEPVVFTATQSGPVGVVARNVLNPRPTVRYSVPPIAVSPVARVNPYTFAGARVTGLTGGQVGELAQALARARADGLELDPWAAGRRTLQLSPEHRDAAARDVASLDDLLGTVSAQVSRGLDHQRLHTRLVDEARRIPERSAPPSLARLRWPRRPRGERA